VFQNYVDNANWEVFDMEQVLCGLLQVGENHQSVFGLPDRSSGNGTAAGKTKWKGPTEYLMAGPVIFTG